MSSSQLRARIAALQGEACAVGAQLAAQGGGIGPDELFEVAGPLQGVANAVEGAQLVARGPERAEPAVVGRVERELDLGDLIGHRGHLVPLRHLAAPPR